MCTEIVYITKKRSIFIHYFVTWCHSFPLCQDFSNPITHRAETDTFSVITEVRQGDRFYQTSAASPDTLTDKQAQMLPFLLSTQPYNRRLGDSVQECKCVCLCVCRLVPLPGGKCWLLMSFFYSFHKTQSHRLNWASDSHSPVSLTVPLSWCVSLSLSLFLSLAMEKLIEEKKRQESFQWSPLAPYEVVQLRLKCNISSSKTCVCGIFSLESLILFCMDLYNMSITL